jgi:hypothetical protein
MALSSDEKRRLAEIINGHPLMATDELRVRLVELAEFHLKHDDDEQFPLFVVSPCLVISLLREVLMYRDQYGLIEQTAEQWLIESDIG